MIGFLDAELLLNNLFNLLFVGDSLADLLLKERGGKNDGQRLASAVKAYHIRRLCLLLALTQSH